MMEDCCTKFGEAGLEVCWDKTHWSSSIALDGETLAVRGKSIVWERKLEFIGSVIEPGAHSGGAVRRTFAGATRLAAVGRTHRMGPNSSWPSSQGGEVASSISECSSVTEVRRRAVGTSSTIRRCSPTCQQSSSEPRRGIGSCTSAGVSSRGSVGSVGRVRFHRSPNIAGGFEPGSAFSAGTANQRTDQGHRRVHREVNKQAPSFGEETQRGGAIVGECRSPFGQAARVGRQAHHQHPTQPIWTSKSPI